MNEIASHVEEGALQALADGELDPAVAEPVERHLAECAECRAQLDTLHQASLTLSAALRELDRPVAGTVPFRAPRRRVAPARQGWGALPRAAVLVLGLAGAASAAIPGSPVRAWVESLIPTTASEAGEPTVADREAAPAVEAPVAGPEAGVSITPEGGAVRIVLGDAGGGLSVSAVLVDHRRAGVYASEAAADARFTTGPGRIDVQGAAGGVVRIEIPREARSAEVVVNGRLYVAKDGAMLRLAGTDIAAAGSEVTFTVR